MTEVTDRAGSRYVIPAHIIEDFLIADTSRSQQTCDGDASASEKVASRLGASGLGASGLGASGLGASGLDTGYVGASGFDQTNFGSGSRDPVGVLMAQVQVKLVAAEMLDFVKLDPGCHSPFAAQETERWARFLSDERICGLPVQFPIKALRSYVEQVRGAV